MSVFKIALGVFLGNLLFAILMWAIISTVQEGARKDAMYNNINSQYNAMIERNGHKPD